MSVPVLSQPLVAEAVLPRQETPVKAPPSPRHKPCRHSCSLKRRRGRPVRTRESTTKVQHSNKTSDATELLSRQGPAQLGPQSQSLSRSYGSSLPTSLTYMCLTLQRLRTFETGCGNRVRSVSNSHYKSVCFVNTPRPRLHGPAGTTRRTR